MKKHWAVELFESREAEFAMKKTDIDWERVEAIMLRSFRGEKVYDDEYDITRKAFEADPEHYGLVSRRVRGGEIQRIRGLG